MWFKALYLPIILPFWFISAVYASDFEMKAVPVEGRTIAGGPVVIDVSIRYTGRKPIVITEAPGTGGTGSLTDMRQGFSAIQAPGGWKKRKVSTGQGGTFQFPKRRLQPGDVIRKKVFLHYCFSEIPAGKATVELSYPVAGRNGVGGKLLAKLSTKVELDVVEGSPAELHSLFSQTMKVVRDTGETPKGKAHEEWLQSCVRRLNACRQLIWVKHESVLPFLFKILQIQSAQVDACHSEARSSIYSLSTSSESALDGLVDYLLQSGKESDARFFFWKWKRDKVDIGRERILKLLQSEKPWIKDAARETFAENTSQLQSPNDKPIPEQPTKPSQPEPKVREALTGKPSEAQPDSGNWLLPGMIGAVIVLAGVVIFLILRRRG